MISRDAASVVRSREQSRANQNDFRICGLAIFRGCIEKLAPEGKIKMLRRQINLGQGDRRSMIARVGQRLMEIREPASLLPRRIDGPRLVLAVGG